MHKKIHRRSFLKCGSALALGVPTGLHAADRTEAAREMAPTIVRTRELMAREPNPSTTAGHLWRLHQSTTSRTNLVQMRGEAGEHIHPDAEHSLYVISGELTVRTGNLETTLREGDYISIPAGLKHGYTVAPGKTALLISMDAPPYDPQKTVRTNERK